MESPVKTQRVRKHRVRYIVIILFLLLVVNALAVYYFWRAPFPAKKPLLVCEDEACTFTALRFINNFDVTVSPCENFYQFACGGFIRNAEIPPGKKKTSVTVELEYKVQKDLNDLLENYTSNSDSLSKPYAKLVELYTLCMDQLTINRDGLSEARKLLQEAGGWPLLDNATVPDNWTFLDTEKRLKAVSLDGNSLIKVSVDTSTSGVHFLIHTPELGLPVSELIQGMSAPRVKTYFQYMVDMVVLYGANSQEATAIMKQVLDLETALAEVVDSQHHTPFSTNYTLSDLKGLPSMSWVPWSELLQLSVPKAFTVTDHHTVFIDHPEYIMKLENVLKQKQSKVIADYMFWRAAEGLAPLVSYAHQIKYLEHKGEPITPRWQECVQIVARKMDVALSSLYIKEYFSQTTKDTAEALVENIRQEMIQNVQESDIKESAKLKATDQVKRITTHIAYPDEILHINKIEEYYNELNMSKDNYLRAFADVTRWHRENKINRVLQGKASDDWASLGDLSSPEASFSSKKKSITVNAGLLQPPLFSNSQPLYINYGSIGYLVAHHFTHTLQVEEDNKKGDGKIVYKDAIKLAFKAYRKYVEKLAIPEPVLPTLEQYSDDQLLVLSMANMLCTKYRPEAMANTTKSHIETKVNGVVKNFPEFGEIFHC